MYSATLDCGPDALLTRGCGVAGVSFSSFLLGCTGLVSVIAAHLWSALLTAPDLPVTRRHQTSERLDGTVLQIRRNDTRSALGTGFTTPSTIQEESAGLRAELFRLSCRIGAHPHWVDDDPSRLGRTRLWQAAQIAPGGEPQVVVRLAAGKVVVTEPKGRSA